MREYSMCTRVCSRVHVYIRARVCVWRGLVAARLPASALGCAARQDVEPSATQPGDHPRVQPALSPFSSSSLLIPHHTGYFSLLFLLLLLLHLRYRVFEKRCARANTLIRSLSLSVSRALSAELAVTSSFFLRPSSPDISRSAKGVEPPHLPRRENILQGPSYPPAQGSPLLQLLLRTHGKHFCR